MYYAPIRVDMVVKRNSKQEGFTLWEVLIAIVVLSFALLALAQMSIMTIKVNASSQQRTTALNLAQDKLEILKRTPYTQIVSGNDTSGLFSRNWNIQNDFPAAGMKTLNLQVSWAQGTKSVSLQSIVTP